MGADVEEEGIDVDAGWSDNHFQAGEDFFVKASAVPSSPLLEGGMHRLRNVLKCYCFHNSNHTTTIMVVKRHFISLASFITRPVRRGRGG